MILTTRVLLLFGILFWQVLAKKPWEFGRFVNTVRFYNAFQPKIPFLSKIFKGKNRPLQDVTVNSVIWSIDNPTMDWGPLDDVVMGGVSKSDLKVGQKFDGNWTGFVTTENNGGFAGIRTKLFKTPSDVSSCKGLVLKVKGDGLRYKCIIRDDDEWNGIAWSKSFDTVANKELSIKIPFDSFVPTKFAKTVPMTVPFNKKSLSAIQLTLSKFEYDGGLNPKFREGPFKLQLESILTY